MAESAEPAKPVEPSEPSPPSEPGPGLMPYVWSLSAYLLLAFSIPLIGLYMAGAVAGFITGFKVVRSPLDMGKALMPAFIGAAAFVWWLRSNVPPDATDQALTAAKLTAAIAGQSVLAAAVTAALGAAAGYNWRGE